MKFLLIILLIFAVMSIAMQLSNQIKDKNDFYKNLSQFLKLYKLNVSFRQEKILDFLNSIKSKKQFALFIEKYKLFLKTNELDLSSIKILDADEKEELKKIITSIGKNDIENEIKQIDGFLLNIETKLEATNKEKEKLCPLIIKLSLLFACGLAIILI